MNYARAPCHMRYRNSLDLEDVLNRVVYVCGQGFKLIMSLKCDVCFMFLRLQRNDATNYGRTVRNMRYRNNLDPADALTRVVDVWYQGFTLTLSLECDVYVMVWR